MFVTNFQSHNTLSWTRSDGIGNLILNMPPSNTMSFRFFNEFKEWIGNPDRFDGLKAVIIHGAGRHFSSGSDLDSLLSEIDRVQQIVSGEDTTCSVPPFLPENYNSFLALERLNLPVIAAISGVCIGSGFELSLFCDFRICTHDAVLGLPESTFGLMPGLGGIQRFAQLAGKSRAVEYVLRGCTFQASDALEMGLVDLTVPRSELLNACHDLILHLPGVHDRELRKLTLSNYRRIKASNGVITRNCNKLKTNDK
ncbi:MAG TPA: enoyl-CoA hydratase/isomerase family protein [Bacteroidales bacterium]|nr:enoyl-CoA hydratase/isomerase family protein [Bacteroidales bacterium]HPS50425.1 enoyl-CoA hydratase/isomerase family protein [Bacteroidales bacterium]